MIGLFFNLPSIYKSTIVGSGDSQIIVLISYDPSTEYNIGTKYI